MLRKRSHSLSNRCDKMVSTWKQYCVNESSEQQRGRKRESRDRGRSMSEATEAHIKELAAKELGQCDWSVGFKDRKMWLEVRLEGRISVKESFMGQSLHACQVASVVSLCDPVDCSPTGSSVHGILLGVGWHAPLQGFFPTQGSKLCLLRLCIGRQVLYPWRYQGSLRSLNLTL